MTMMINSLLKKGSLQKEINVWQKCISYSTRRNSKICYFPNFASMSLSRKVKKLIQVENRMGKVRLLDRNQEGSNKKVKKQLPSLNQIICVTHFYLKKCASTVIRTIYVE